MNFDGTLAGKQTLRADAHGIDIESALRNRLREVEQRLVALESNAA